MSLIKGFLCSILFSVISFAPAWSADIKNSSDHPEIGRFSGSTILGYKQDKFNEYLFPEGKVYRDKDDTYKYEKSSVIEGKVTRIYYVSPKGTSTLEVFKNYEKQLKKKGYEMIFQCKGNGDYDDCGSNMSYMENFKPELTKYAYYVGDNRYVSMKKTDPEGGDVYVSLFIFTYSFDFYPRYKHTVVQLDVVEVESIDDEQIEIITADKISSEVAEQGRIALYGIYFDTDKSELKAESDAALEQIHKALSSNTDMKLHVVGHTDNEGSFEHNLKLSKARANAVMDALVKLGIDAKRLQANGVASLAPVASNSGEEGRAKNRRVELVAQ